MNELDRRSGQKVLDWKEAMTNRQGARSVNMMEPRMEVILLDSQLRQDG